jgi:hypothetical protein
MQKIDIQNFNKYYRKNDGNATLARVGHVNYLLDLINQITENVYADNTAALAAGLEVGALYSTATGAVRVVV